MSDFTNPSDPPRPEDQPTVGDPADLAAPTGDPIEGMPHPTDRAGTDSPPSPSDALRGAPWPAGPPLSGFPTPPGVSTPGHVGSTVETGAANTLSGVQRLDDNGRLRPRWGMGDIALGALFVGVVLVVAMFVLAIVEASLDGSAVATEDYIAPVWFVVMGGFFQQGAMAAWPLLVSRWKGLGPAADWGWRAVWADLGIGAGVGVAMVIGAGLVSFALGMAVSLEDQGEASNTEFLQDAANTPWIVPMILMVVIGAPISEELFFRGLVLRTVQKRFGLAIGVAASSVLFTAVHFQGGTWQGAVVLLGSLSVVGTCLGVLAAKTGRLGPSIAAHMTFNLIGVALTLASDAANVDPAMVGITLLSLG